MPPSTLDRPRTRTHASEWVVVVPGQQPAPPPDRLPEPAGFVAPHPQSRQAPVAFRPRLSLPTSLPAGLSTVIHSAVGRLVLMVGFACAAVAVLGLVTGRDPLLALGLKTPHFVAYQGTSLSQGASGEPVHFVMDDGWGLMAAVPGALLMDWQEGQSQPALKLTMGNPAALPEVETLSADGSRINEIRYRSVWPGIDAVISTMAGGWACNMIVEPGVNPAIIEMEYIGATALSVDAAGRLHVQTPNGVWIDGTPESWQDGPSGREPVASSYELRGGNRFGFTVGAYDLSRPLVVDPPSERAN